MVDELGSRSEGDAAQSYFVELARRPGFLAVLYPYLDHHDPAVRKRLCDVLMFWRFVEPCAARTAFTRFE